MALDLVGRGDDGTRQAEHEVGHRVAGNVAGEGEQPAGIVGRAAAGGETPQVEAGPEVVRARRVGEDVGGLERGVELIPVGPAGAEAGEVGDVDAGKPGVAVGHVAVESRNAERRAGVARAANRERIERVEVDPVIADAEVVVEIRLQGVGIPSPSSCTRAGTAVTEWRVASLLASCLSS